MILDVAKVLNSLMDNLALDELFLSYEAMLK